MTNRNSIYSLPRLIISAALTLSIFSASKFVIADTVELVPARDIWTTSVYSYVFPSAGPGGGLNNDQLRVGGWGDEYRSLLKFDVSGITSPIISATLVLYHVGSPDVRHTPVSMHLDRVTSDWDWTIEPIDAGTRDNDRLWWDDRPNFVNHSTNLPAPGISSFWQTDVTELVNGYITGAYENHGIQLRPTSTSAQFNYFASVDHANEEWRPRLVLELLESSGNNPPELDPIGDKAGLEGDLLEFTITASDTDPSDVLTFSASNLPPGSVFNPQTATFSWTPEFNQAGYYQDVEFTVTDNGTPLELDIELINITIGNANRAPVIDPILPIVSMENELIEVLVNAIDPDGDQIVLSASSLPAGAYFDSANGILTWIPDEDQAGNYSISITAQDNGAPQLQSQADIVISVGDVLTPSEQSEDLINDVMFEDFPKSQENSYMANLKKVEDFINDGKIISATQQILSFIAKVTQDSDRGEISSNTASMLISKAQQLLLDIVAKPDLKLPLPGGESWRLTVEVGGVSDDSVDDPFHKPNAHYYSLDFVDDKNVNGIKTHVDDVDILAAGNGRVFDNGSNTYGNYVIIDHDYPFDGNGYTTLYAHMKDRSSLEIGQSIAQGDVIGIMGTTPGGIYSSGIHLHFEVRYDGSSKKSTMDKLGSILIDGLAIEDYKVGSVENPLYYPSTQQ